jgi:hypothetical protein
MPETSTRHQYLIAIGIGAAHALILAVVWGVLAVRMPFVGWILDAYAGVWNEWLLKSVVYAHDLVINIIVAIPFACLIARLKPSQSWKFLWIAVAVSIVIVNWSVFANFEWFANVLKMWSFYLGTAVMIVALPLAFALVVATNRRTNAV